MLKSIIYNPKVYRKINLTLLPLIVLIFVFAIFLYIMPTKVFTPSEVNTDLNLDGNLSVNNDAGKLAAEISKNIWPGLFKSTSMLISKPMADKTIDKIYSKLKLRCIMQIDNRKTAYIRIKSQGMKRCRVGDVVDNMFTVLDIGDSSVDISVIGHRVTLKK